MIKCPERLNPPSKDKINKLYKRVERLPTPIKTWNIIVLSDEERNTILPYIDNKELFENAVLWVFTTIPLEDYKQSIQNNSLGINITKRLNQLNDLEALCYIERLTMLSVGMIFLEAGYHGLEACPVWFFDEEKIKNILGTDNKITAIVGFGEATLVDILEDDEVIL